MNFQNTTTKSLKANKKPMLSNQAQFQHVSGEITVETVVGSMALDKKHVQHMEKVKQNHFAHISGYTEQAESLQKCQYC